MVAYPKGHWSPAARRQYGKPIYERSDRSAPGIGIVGCPRFLIRDGVNTFYHRPQIPEVFEGPWRT